MLDIQLWVFKVCLKLAKWVSDIFTVFTIKDPVVASCTTSSRKCERGQKTVSNLTTTLKSCNVNRALLGPSEWWSQKEYWHGHAGKHRYSCSLNVCPCQDAASVRSQKPSLFIKHTGWVALICTSPHRSNNTCWITYTWKENGIMVTMFSYRDSLGWSNSTDFHHDVIILVKVDARLIVGKDGLFIFW